MTHSRHCHPDDSLGSIIGRATPALGRIVVRPRSFVAVTDLSKIFDRANLVRAYRWIMPADPKEKCKDKVAEVGLR